MRASRNAATISLRGGFHLRNRWARASAKGVAKSPQVEISHQCLRGWATFAPKKGPPFGLFHRRSPRLRYLMCNFRLGLRGAGGAGDARLCDGRAPGSQAAGCANGVTLATLRHLVPYHDVPLRFECVRLTKLQIQFPGFSIWLSMIGSNSSTFLMR
jgi:hypothetical protein